MDYGIYNEDIERLYKTAFSKVMKINLKTNEFYIIKIDEEEQILRTDFSGWIENFYEEGNIHKNYKERYYHQYNNQLLIEHFNENDTPKIIEYLRYIQHGCWVAVRSIIIKSIDYTPENPIVYLYLINLGDYVYDRYDENQ